MVKKKFLLATIVIVFFLSIFFNHSISMKILNTIFPPISTRDVYFLNEMQINDLSQKALNGDDKAAMRLADFYIFAERDDQKSIHWLTVAAKLGNLSAHSDLALMLEKSNRRSEAMEWLTKAAKLGDLAAHSDLALMLEKSDRRSEAMEWLTKAAEKGSLIAQNRLSTMYLEQGDTDKAIYWLTLAAGGQGTKPLSNSDMTVIAQVSLGELLLAEGRKDEAVKWLIVASENGHPRAQYVLAKIFFEENKQDEANKWAKEATKYASTHDNAEWLIKEITKKNKSKS